MADTMTQIRAEIDALDREIIALIAQRQSRVVRAGELKRGQPHDAVRDPSRVEAVIATSRATANEVGANPDVVERTYRAMIAAFIAVELSVHTDGDS